LAGLHRLLHHWRVLGDKIVFTNGCFDVLHVGHITLLNQCAIYGDRVIVGLNSDISIKKIKGENRPIQQEQDRALILAALENVDAVILFDEETPLALVEAVLPDVLVKGGDYAVHTIVGASEVISHGGRVEIVDVVAGKSTTNIASRIAKL
jgi:D-beta-D-heptose 7-phosphate kinase/D-beta-D-heptose 1-phosphate adenosyltransferase